MKFVLIMSTLGRTWELGRFFDSLAAQSVKDVEVYLCDQNADDRLDAVLAPYAGRLSIEVVKAGGGLSRGRNAALARARAALAQSPAAEDVCIAFPDDDCWYVDPRLLATVAERLRNEEELDGLTIRSVDEHGAPSARTSPKVDTDLTPGNLFVGSMAISYSIFLKRRFVDAVGDFDPSLGVGAGTRWGAGEESDYLLRGLRAGLRLRYYPDLEVSHPRRDAVSVDASRLLSYARGHGRVLRQNGYSPAHLALEVAKTTAAFFVFTVTRRRLMTPYIIRAWGYAVGYVASPRA